MAQQLKQSGGIPRCVGRSTGRFPLMVYLLAAGMLFLLWQQARAASGATLEWDPNLEPDLAGYKLHYGTSSGAYTRLVDAGQMTSVNVPELVSGFTYYFVVTAYNDAGVESPPSNEVVFTIPWPDDLRITYLPRSGIPVAPDWIECTPALGQGPNGFVFSVTAAERSAVVIYSSEDLETWAVQGAVTNPTGRLLIRDMESPLHPRRYYRLKLAQIDPVVD